MTDKKRKYILIGLGLAIILVLGVGVTYAYFQARIDSGDSANVDVTSDTTDNLSLTVDNEINLSINQFNFGPEAGNLESSAIATAKLRANSSKETATYNYYVYFNIEGNNFIYTTEDSKPEIVLTITDPDGNEVTAIEGLNYVTATNADGTTVSGFDITTASGLFTIADNYEITSNSSKVGEETIQNWTFKATFINLNSDQEANTGKSMNGKVVMQRNPVNATLADVCTTGDNLAECVKKLSDGNILGTTNIIHHNGTIKDTNGNVKDANDGSYRYAGRDYVSIKEDYSATYKVLKKTSALIEGALISFMCGETESYIGAACAEATKYYYLAYGENKTHYEHPSIALDQAVKDGYVNRNYVDNFVCFGSDDEVCPYDNLYRIIGVFEGKIKLIKFDAANENLLGSDGERSTANYTTTGGTYRSDYKGYSNIVNGYHWNSINFDDTNSKYGFSNIWENSELNTVNLNTNFLNNLDGIAGGKWSGKIALSNWHVGGGTYAELRKKPLDVFTSEFNTLIENLPNTYEAKIGLMYISDYAFAGAKNTWNINLSSAITTRKSFNWLYSGLNEWTLTRFIDETNDNYKKSVGKIASNSIIGTYSAGYVNTVSAAVRPVFYLNSNVTYANGDGSIENPIRIGD